MEGRASSLLAKKVYVFFKVQSTFEATGSQDTISLCLIGLSGEGVVLSSIFRLLSSPAPPLLSVSIQADQDVAA